MKQSQWILTVLLGAAMVFGITFALNYLDFGTGGKVGPTSQGSDNLEVTFPERRFPYMGMPPLEMEKGQDGFHDFWFVNDNKKPVAIGLNAANCQCSSAAVYLVGKPWADRRAAVGAGEVAALSLGSLASLGLAAGVETDPVLKNLTEEIKGKPIKKDAEGVEVPAGKAGWVRLSWKGARQGQAPVTVLGADIWMQQRGGSTVRLEAGVQFLDPLKILNADRQRKLPDLNPRELPLNLSILCWSSTRGTLDLKAELVSGRGRPGADPFVVGAPVPLSPEECHKLETSFTDPADLSVVRCAYRIPVTIRDRPDNGKSMLDIGPFRRLVMVKLNHEEEREPVLVTLQGTIQGEVFVGGGEEAGRVLFHTFKRREGASQAVLVSSETPGLKLEVDRERTAPFLDVTLPESGHEEGGKQVWRMKVAVQPNRVSGSFPRNDDPTYHDSAIYLRTLGPDARTLRIPTEGTAID